MSEVAWVEAPGGYALALDDGKLVCRNAKGRILASVPKKVRESETAQQLAALSDWLSDHARTCRETPERWMLRSLPVPRAALSKVWPDPDWRGVLENLVVWAIDDAGEPDPDAAGFLRGADEGRGVGVVTLDGETEWLDAERVALPHPILLEELDDWRGLATELGVQQGLRQLFREVFTRPDELDADARSVERFANGRFEELRHALGRCRTLGYRVSGGFAVCPVWEAGRLVEARFWLGAEDPEWEAHTGDLIWVDARERGMKVAEVGPVAFSEGMRMASAIYAARAKDEEQGGDA